MQTLHVNRLEIKNFMRISALTVDADGKHVAITGPNSSGKTSSVDALWAALGGKPTRDMPEPIKQGAEQASVTLDLGEFIVERKWTRSGSMLTMRAKDGNKIQRPQEVLDGLMGRYSLDPIAFLKRKAQEQVADALTVMGIEPPVEEIAELTGERVEPAKNETADLYLARLVGNQSGIYYVRRTELGRTADLKKKAFDDAFATLMSIGGPLSSDEVTQDVSGLHSQLKSAYEEQSNHQGLLVAERNLQSSVKRMASDKAQFELQRADEQSRRNRIREQITRLEEEFEQSIKKTSELNSQIEKSQEELESLGKQHSEAYCAAERLPNPSKKIEELNTAIQLANEKTEENAKRKHETEQCQRLREEWSEAQGDYESLDGIIQSIKDIGRGLLDGISLGIDGLVVGDGELRLNGVSFAQASHAQKLRVACAVAMKQNPALKVLRVDDGEHLDAESRKALFELVEANNWQVFITAVADTESIRVEIIDKE